MSKLKNKQEIYFNPAQMDVLLVDAKETWIIAGRGIGKSEGMIAPWIYRRIFDMPKGNGAIVVPTFRFGLEQTLPSTFHGLDNLGMKKDIHYVFGKKPPERLMYQKPYIEPLDHTHCFSFFNGTAIQLISQDRIGSSNSRNLDFIVLDEAKLLKYDKLVNETFQANRGNTRYFGRVPHHHAIIATTDQPTTKLGAWLWEKEKLMTKKEVVFIKSLIKEYIRLSGIDNKRQYQYMQEKMNMIKLLRGDAIYFKEFSSLENIAVLGEEFISQMKRDLPDFIFKTSILNRRPTRVENGFYAAINPDIHYYDADDITVYDRMRDEYDNIDFRQALSINCIRDKDLMRDKPLHIAFDYNAAINWAVVGQPHSGTLRILNSIFVKTPRKLKELINEVCDYYEPMQRKEVVYHYNHTALQGSYAIDNIRFNDIVIDCFHKRGWHVDEAYAGHAMRHEQKHMLIDMSLKGQKKYMPIINRQNNIHLITAIEQTGIKMVRNGFVKDKDHEKDKSDTIPYEVRTDATDAFDDLLIGLTLSDNRSYGATTIL